MYENIYKLTCREITKATMYYRNSGRIDISELPQLSLVLVHAIFLFHFSSLIFLLDFYPSFSRARFRLLLLERPANHRCDPFEFSSLKLLYTFSCSKVLDSLPPISAASSDAFARNVTTLLYIVLTSNAVISRF